MRLDVDEALEFDAETSRRLRGMAPEDEGHLVSGVREARAGEAPSRASALLSWPFIGLWRLLVLLLRLPIGAAALLWRAVRALLQAAFHLGRWLLRILWRWGLRLAIPAALVGLVLAVSPPSGLPRAHRQRWQDAQQALRSWLEPVTNGFYRLSSNRAMEPRSSPSLAARELEAAAACRPVPARIGHGRWWLVASGYVNLRAGPGNRWAVRGRLGHGEVVPIHRREGPWRRIEIPGGAAGWVYGPLGLELERLGCGTTRVAPGVPLCRQPDARCRSRRVTHRSEQLVALKPFIGGGWTPVLTAPDEVSYLPPAGR